VPLRHASCAEQWKSSPPSKTLAQGKFERPSGVFAGPGPQALIRYGRQLTLTELCAYPPAILPRLWGIRLTSFGGGSLPHSRAQPASNATPRDQRQAPQSHYSWPPMTLRFERRAERGQGARRCSNVKPGRPSGSVFMLKNGSAFSAGINII